MAVIGARGFSNGDANRKNCPGKIENLLDLQAFWHDEKKTRTHKKSFPVSFCAGNKIFASQAKLVMVR